MKKLHEFLFDDAGATAIEYALIAAGIALVIVTAVNTLGGNLKNQYQNIGNVIP